MKILVEKEVIDQALEALIEAKVVAERYQNAEKREQAITALREALAEQAECKECGAKQAQIDRLMLEYCPDEMTPEQVQEWVANQKFVQEQEPVAEALRLSEEAIEYARQGGKIGSGIYGKALAAIRSAKEPQITTPDVCGEVCARAKLCYGCGKALDEANAKFAEQAEQEPVAIIEKEAGFETEVYATGHADSLPDGVFKLYAAPVRTKDLTDDEIAAVTGYRKSGATWPVVEEVARAVLAKFKEVNNL